MLDMFNKKALEAAKAQLANTQVQLANQAKKTKTAVIIGGSTTGAAAAVAAICHFGLGRGNKKIKEKINNYDMVVEERNTALGEITGLKAKCEHAEALAVAADGCCCKMSAAFDSNDPAEIYAARQGHKKIHASIFGDVSQESVNAAVAAYDEFIKSLTAQDQNAQNQNNQTQNQTQNQNNQQNNQTQNQQK